MMITDCTEGFVARQRNRQYTQFRYAFISSCSLSY
jgi:hypothetical protein